MKHADYSQTSSAVAMMPMASGIASYHSHCRSKCAWPLMKYNFEAIFLLALHTFRSTNIYSMCNPKHFGVCKPHHLCVYNPDNFV